jgi:hypothetical protein
MTGMGSARRVEVISRVVSNMGVIITYVAVVVAVVAVTVCISGRECLHLCSLNLRGNDSNGVVESQKKLDKKMDQGDERVVENASPHLWRNWGSLIHLGRERAGGAGVGWWHRHEYGRAEIQGRRRRTIIVGVGVVCSSHSVLAYENWSVISKNLNARTYKSVSVGEGEF